MGILVSEARNALLAALSPLPAREEAAWKKTQEL
jgi:hypothetical protein